jgi:hypothetical protein
MAIVDVNKVKLDQQILKRNVLLLWQRGGLDTLVKAMPLGAEPDPDRMIGFCTSLKFIVGRTPAQMEAHVGFAKDSKLVRGAEVFTVRPLPNPADFDLAGYSQTPGGIPTNSPAYVPNPAYPPGEGVPQWDLSRVKQSRLVHLASVSAGQVFRFMLKDLPP